MNMYFILDCILRCRLLRPGRSAEWYRIGAKKEFEEGKSLWNPTLGLNSAFHVELALALTNCGYTRICIALRLCEIRSKSEQCDIPK